MEEYTQITLDQWMQWKEDIRQKLAETANNFVHIGFRLKQIRDSGMYDGAADIFEFAQKEYGLSKSTTSRFIAINEKFSEGGNSLELKAEYRGFSSSKLSEMLTLPDNECQLVTEQTTIKDIRELKEFAREEAARQQVSEDTDGQQASEAHAAHTPFEKCVADFFRNKKDLLNKIMTGMVEESLDPKDAAEMINPSGTISHRKGVAYLFLYDYAGGVKYKQMGRDIEAMTWLDFLRDVFRLYIWPNVPDGDYHGAFYQDDAVAESDAAENDVAGDDAAENDAEDKEDVPRTAEVEKTVKAPCPRNAEPERAVATSQQEKEKPAKKEPEEAVEPVEQEAEVEQAAAGQDKSSQEAAEGHNYKPLVQEAEESEEPVDEPAARKEHSAWDDVKRRVHRLNEMILSAGDAPDMQAMEAAYREAMCLATDIAKVMDVQAKQGEQIQGQMTVEEFI